MTSLFPNSEWCGVARKSLENCSSRLALQVFLRDENKMGFFSFICYFTIVDDERLYSHPTSFGSQFITGGGRKLL